MLNTDRFNEIHRLFHGEHWSARKIARHLHLSRKTLRKYIQSPVQTPARRQRTSRIDPFKSTVADLLEQDPTASAVVILQRLRPLGYDGGITVLRNYVRQLRGPVHPPRAFRLNASVQRPFFSSRGPGPTMSRRQLVAVANRTA